MDGPTFDFTLNITYKYLYTKFDSNTQGNDYYFIILLIALLTLYKLVFRSYNIILIPFQ